MSSADRKQSELDIDDVCEDRLFIVMYGFIMLCKK